MNPATNVKSIVPYIGSMNSDGLDDACTIADSAIPASAFHDGFVLFGWINPRSVTTSNNIMDKSNAANSSGGFRFGFSTNNRLSLRIDSGSDRVSATNSILLNKNVHVCVNVSSAGIVTFYVDRVISGTAGATSLPSAIVTTNPLTIGNRSNATDRTFDGHMAQVGILSLAGRGDLTQEEINALYLHNVIPAGTKLLHLETTANQIKGNQWLDKSGNNNHATIVGPTFSYEAPTKRIAQLGAPRQLDGRLDGLVSGGVTIADGAMVFDENTNYVRAKGLDRTLFNQAGTFTVANWLKLSSLPSATRKSVWNFQDGGSNRISCTIENSGTLSFARYDGASYFGKSTEVGFIKIDTDYLVFCELKDGAPSLNVNLVEFIGSGSYYAGGENNNRLQFGFMTGTNTAFSVTGKIGGVVFNRTLTAEERTAIFNAGPNAPCPVKRGLVAEYSGRDYEGAPATPTKIFDVASWDGLNVQ